MDFLNALLSFEIAGNKVWRILVLFGIILLGFILGKVVKSLFLRFAGKLESTGRSITAVTIPNCPRNQVLLSPAGRDDGVTRRARLY